MTDVTAILDSSGNQLFPTAHILKLSASPSNTYAKHVLEDGTVVADNKIRNQNLITITAILDPADYQSVYKQVKEASNNNTEFSIQTRVDTFVKMYIESYPSEESAAIYDTISLTISFEEQQTGIVETQGLKSQNVANQSDTDTQNRGEQLPKNEPTNQTTLQKIFG